jgi:hypothetical protein
MSDWYSNSSRWPNRPSLRVRRLVLDAWGIEVGARVAVQAISQEVPWNWRQLWGA